MTKTDFKKEHILYQIYDYFVTSSDYNGLSLAKITDSINSTIIQILIELIDEEYVCAIAQSHDENPHIIRFGFLAKGEQITYLKKYDGHETICLYPSPSYLKEHRNVSNLELQPFNKMMALGFPQLKACYFNYDVLNTYASDPRMNMKFNDYSGSIKSNEDIGDANSINLKTFGIGRQNDSIIIVSYPRYLQRMSTSNQFVWISHRIDNNSDCKTLKAYLDNQFRCCWHFPNTVYRSILKEISNINDLTGIAFGKTLFLKTYSKTEIPNFDMLTFPSLDIYNNFLLLLEKVVISNIDIHFFEAFVDTEDFNEKPKGTLVCLKEWIEMVKKDFADDIYSSLHKVRRERQPAAHRIEANKYSNEYLLKQHKLCTEVYTSLNLLRRLLQSHPKVKDYSVKYPNTQYIEI
jgi:hypothetical protein